MKNLLIFSGVFSLLLLGIANLFVGLQFWTFALVLCLSLFPFVLAVYADEIEASFKLNNRKVVK